MIKNLYQFRGYLSVLCCFAGMVMLLLFYTQPAVIHNPTSASDVYEAFNKYRWLFKVGIIFICAGILASLLPWLIRRFKR